MTKLAMEREKRGTGPKKGGLDLPSLKIGCLPRHRSPATCLILHIVLEIES